MKILGKFLSTIAFMAILFIIIFIAASALMSTNKEGTFSIGDYSMFNVLTTSMLPEFGEGSIILVKKVYTEDELKEQDIITFYPQDGNTTVLTHRIISVDDDEGTQTYQTKGDNNDIPDNFDVTFNRVIGKVIFSADGVGQIMEKIRSPLGIGIVVGATALLMLVAHLLEDKKKKKKKKRKRKASAKAGSRRGARSRPAAAYRSNTNPRVNAADEPTFIGHDFYSAPVGSNSTESDTSGSDYNEAPHFNPSFTNAPQDLAMLNGAGHEGYLFNGEMPDYHSGNTGQMINFENQATIIGGLNNMYTDPGQSVYGPPQLRPEPKKSAAKKKAKPTQSLFKMGGKKSNKKVDKKGNTDPRMKRTKTRRDDFPDPPMEIPPY